MLMLAGQIDQEFGYGCRKLRSKTEVNNFGYAVEVTDPNAMGYADQLQEKVDAP
jgi:hypothetical protein